MTSWRIDLTVLADLAASMFAACFMVLLIFLSLAQRADAPPSRPIVAKRDLRIVERQVSSSAELVNLLHDHAAAGGVSIDLFADRVDVLTPTGKTSLRGNEIASLVMPSGPVRLYVSSNVFYHDVAAALGNRPVTEMSVPSALKGPDGHWRPEFLALDAERLEPLSFRERLAQLLKGGAEGEGSAGGSGGMPPAFGPGLLERISALLGAIAAIGFPALGLGLVVLIERRRYGSRQAMSLRGQ
jgi:hypothetical protein